MSTKIVKLNDIEIQRHLRELSGWQINGGELQREFSLASFPSAIFFVSTIAQLAELEAHHPDILISYNKVALTLSTHTVSGITAKDFMLAQKIDAAWSIFTMKA